MQKRKSPTKSKKLPRSKASRVEAAKARRKAYIEANKIKIALQKKNYYERNKEKLLAKDRENKLRVYGLTSKSFESMLIRQNNRCLICAEVFKTSRHRHIDHDHKTGKVRGILCNYCNHLLGVSRDSVEILKSAIKYLKRGSL